MTKINHEKKNRMSKAGPSQRKYLDPDSNERLVEIRAKKLRLHEQHHADREILKRLVNELESIVKKFDENQLQLFRGFWAYQICCRHGLPILHCANRCRFNDTSEIQDIQDIEELEIIEFFNSMNEERVQLIRELKNMTTAVDELEKKVEKTQKHFSNP